MKAASDCRFTPVAYSTALRLGAPSKAARKSSVIVPVVFRGMEDNLHVLSASFNVFLSLSSCVHDAHGIYVFMG